MLLRIFVYFHIFAVFVWTLPPPPEDLRLGLVELSAWEKIRYSPSLLLHWNERYVKLFYIEDYLRIVGAQQNWNMFAPNPVTHDVWVDARIELKNGSEAYFLYPRSSKMGIGERFIKERFRKYIETVHLEDNAFLWPSLAAWVARQIRHEPENPPVYVRLYRHSRKIAGPREEPYEFVSFMFFETPVLTEEN